MASIPDSYDKPDNFLARINHNEERFISPTTKSPGFISAGDVLMFRYKGDPFYKFVIVVKIKRGEGLFTSSRGNKLLACFKLDGTTPETLKILLKYIYKNRRLADYYKIQEAMAAIFGMNSFRSYNLSYINYLNELTLDLRRLDNG